MFDDAFRRHVASRVESTKLELAPFPHFYVTELIPADTYAQLIALLPADADYQTYKPPYEARLYMDLNEKQVARLPEKVRAFWVGFEQWINSQAFLDLMVARFGALLETNAKQRRSQLKEASDRNGNVPIASRTLLARDYAHFALGPHTDSKNKFITALYYLPKNDDLRQFGTSIYRPKKAGYTSWESEHHKHEDFDLVRTFENRPNSFFAFMKSDHSFHGVQPGDYPNVGRDLIMWFPEIGAKQGDGRRLSLPRTTFEPAERPGFMRSLLDRMAG